MEPENQLMYTDDMLYNILLNVKPNDIINMCKINKDAQKICNLDIFWKSKYILDNFPVLIHQTNNWKTEYIKVHNAMSLAKKIVTLGNEEKNLTLNEAYAHDIVLNNKDYYLYLPESLALLVNKEAKKHKNNEITQIDILMYYANNNTDINYRQADVNYLQFMAFNDVGLVFDVDIIANDNIFIDVLTKIIYYNGYTKIVDIFNNSIFIEQLQSLQNYNDIDKMYINHRIKFWKKNKDLSNENWVEHLRYLL